nr:hypothetical protein [Rhodococcus sp. (in: high G+C Gram-positive bacteria)]
MLQFPILNNLDVVVDSPGGWASTAARSIPFAWGAAGVDAAAKGTWGVAIAALIGLLALDAVLLWTWQRLVVRHFVGVSVGRTAPTDSREKERRSPMQTGWRTTRTGAVVQRELSLWRGQLTRRTQLVTLVVSALLSGIGPLLSESVPFSAVWGAWFVFVTALGSGVNWYGYDGSSMWHLVMTPDSARADVRGRQVAWCIVVAPFAVVAAVLVRVLGDTGADGLAVPIAVTLSSLGVGAGVVALVSVSAPYPVPAPKNGAAMNFRGSFNGASFLLTIAGYGALALAAVPGVLLATLVRGAASFVAVPVAAAIGALGFWWGGHRAGTRFESESDRVLLAVTTP